MAHHADEIIVENIPSPVSVGNYINKFKSVITNNNPIPHFLFFFFLFLYPHR